jgi:hypothetical protein
MNMNKSLPEPQRDSVSQPRVAPTALPWVTVRLGRQPQRGCGPSGGGRVPGHNPVGIARPAADQIHEIPFVRGSGLKAARLAPANAPEPCPTLVLENAGSIAEDGWCLIAPFGEWPKTRLYREAGRLREQKYIQVLDAAAADAMVAKENSFFGRLKRAFIGVPVFKGHGDLNEVDPAALSNDQQKIKLGVVDQIRRGARGLEAHFALDNDGAEAVRAGWKFPSGFWYVRPDGTRGDAILARPFKLISVALTPCPNIAGVESLANSATLVAGKAGQASSLTTPKTDRQDAGSTFSNPSGVESLAKAGAHPSEVQPKNESDMKLITGWLLAQGAALASAENPTEPQLLEALQRLHASAAADVTVLGNERQTLSGKLAAVEAERDGLRQQAGETATALALEHTARAAERQGRAEAVADLALQRGRLTVARREAQIAALVNSADFAVAAEALLQGPVVVKMAGEAMSGKQQAGLPNETQQLQAEYSQAFQTELIAAGQNPARAHHRIMTLPQYAGLAARLLPKTN